MFNGMFETFAVACIMIGVAIGAVLFWGVPWLWDLIKPWLHMVTG